MDFIAILQQFVNMKAVLLAIFLTQALKYFLPAPSGEKGTPEIIRGTWPVRLLPFFPLLVGFVVCFLLEIDSHYDKDDAVRGIMSGISAAYGYRTTRVSIFGD
jgi:hypothetical protein